MIRAMDFMTTRRATTSGSGCRCRCGSDTVHHVICGVSMKARCSWAALPASAFLALLVLSNGGTVAGAGQQDPKRKPGFTVGKDTTLVTEPVRKDGRIDYVAA